VDQKKKGSSYNPGQDLSPLIKVPTIRIAELAKSTMHVIDAPSSKFRYSFVHTLLLDSQGFTRTKQQAQKYPTR